MSEGRNMLTVNGRDQRLRKVAVRTLLIVSALLWMASPIVAQQKPLAIESSNMQPSVALGRPMLTWWDVKIQGSGLVVGKFKFVIKSEGYLFATVETEELTLNGPEQRIRVMLPAIDCPQMVDRLNVDISFQGKKYSGDLGQQILRVPFSSRTVFMGLVGESRTVRKRSPQRDKVLERVKFENIIPETKNARGEANESEYVKTIFASIDPVDFPSEPLAYCGFDVVVLMQDEFRNLRKPQLEGLLAWIKSGGSLYLEPNGVLEPYHLDFLRELSMIDRQEFIFQLDQSGRISREILSLDQDAVAFECGLGDVVIRTGDPDLEMTSSAETWRTIIGPLWKSRYRTADRSMTSVVIGIGPDGQPVNQVRANPDPWGFSMAFFNRLNLRPTELLDRLMPDGVRMVPLSLLGFILMAFVFLIGPGDYFGLGWFRARKWTWLTFPAATLAVTALTVWLSNSYMTAAETRRAVIVRDLDAKGDIVRTNRFELLFVASTHQVTTEIERGLFTSLSLGSGLDRFALAGAGMVMTTPNGQIISYPGGAPGTVPGEVQGGAVTSQVEGRIPTQFTATQSLSKWTPQINRIMSIPGSASRSDVNWDELELSIAEADTIRGRGVPPKLMNRVRAQFGENALVACFTGVDGWASDGSQGWHPARNSQLSQMSQHNIRLNVNSNDSFAMSTLYESGLFRWIYQASVATADQGVFALTKQTTPKGGANCDDLPMLDTSDPFAWLLVIVVPEHDDFVVYRKLMRFQD